MYFGAWRDSTASVPADAVGSVQPLSSADYPRTYYMSPARKGPGLLFGFAAIGFGIFYLSSATADVSPLASGIFLIIVGLIAILRDLKYRVVLSADRIEVHNLVSTRVLRRDEILGRRLVQARRGPQIIRLMPQGGHRPLGVPLVLKTDSAFWEWMDTVPDLDAQYPL
jgi:hypothetical protein